MANILFLCTGNSCRSQMAEGIARHLFPSKHVFFSAGTVKHGLNPYAVEVMKEIEIDITEHFSKTLDEIGSDLDFVFTVCSHADETCPVSLKGKTIHKGFDDPPRLAKDLIDKEEILKPYRRVRDEIMLYLKNLDSHIGELNEK